MRDWLAHRVAATPDAEALVSAATGRTWTYADLDEAADEMARRLAGLGVGPGDHVAVVVSPRIEYVTLVHATMRLGARLVPTSHELTPAELRPRLDAADATVLVCEADTEGTAVEATAATDEGEAEETGEGREARNDEGEAAGNGDEGSTTADGQAGTAGEPTVPVVSLDEADADRVAHLKAAEGGEIEPSPWTRGQPLLMLFTSGSTGTSKLVVLTMGNVLASATASAFRLGVNPDARYMAALSFHHTGGIMPLYRAALYGTGVVLRTGFDAGGVADDVREYDVTGISLVPTMLRRMLDARGTLSDSLRVVLLGGAPASEELIERCRHYSIPVHPTYGMTEAASGITVARPGEAFDRVGTVGRPLLWTDVRVRDEDGEELPPGEVGEFVVSGPSVTPGYYRNREANESALGADGLATGDRGYRDEDGYCYVLNRADDRILTGGENVDPGEVLAALREHPEVADAAVVGVPDEEWGERVAALVVPAGEGAERGPGDGPAETPDDAPDRLDAEELRAFCRERLADFKLPRAIRFAEGLPRTDSGTVRRPEVRERLADATGTGDEGPGDEEEGGAGADREDAAGRGDEGVDTDAG
ncbi:class I adenylate-forming enzyme family protein [Halorarum salinum]|uniref:Acyl--CoA ligase n=1 Tax=Halorarum salinum TaxID=2743089 RepID=A0A7D5LAI4_9EURY|nr:class I adenylate-forming enzyme family protein [Halobaculum salinum]QLG62092.1 acyl--CoA ligase [Halobaculum salinum]